MRRQSRPRQSVMGQVPLEELANGSHDAIEEFLRGWHVVRLGPRRHPSTHKGAEDASRAIELDQHHPIGYGHCAIALTQLLSRDW